MVWPPEAAEKALPGRPALRQRHVLTCSQGLCSGSQPTGQVTGSSSPGPSGAEGQSDPCLAHIRSGAGGQVTAGEPRGSSSSGTLGASGPAFLSLTHPVADPGGIGAVRCGSCGCDTVCLKGLDLEG